ncbi:MLP-like protein 34-like [Heracleum sosnowskyi]|uniref:MLP-like protein 34-like n=1 Tax=Heracleum sosnowskyi TaxID=360622 RepID=A0AAD8MQ06_9APIA|nr:MLP-like protein 34-like [Heracleum sosnowskyi]KAK1380783.1 MLP-like protein 34-like [Heracleum sosnowskyi]
MGLIGKLICQTSIKTDGDVFHEIFGTRPHHLHTMTPENIHGCDLHEGEFGKVGSFIIWKYSMDGKQMVEKHRVEAIDEEQKQVTYKVIEGELLKSFKIFVINVHVDTSGVDNLVTWSFDYEKVDESIKDPTEYLDFVLRINKDIETHHLPK